MELWTEDVVENRKSQFQAWQIPLHKSYSSGIGYCFIELYICIDYDNHQTPHLFAMTNHLKLFFLMLVFPSQEMLLKKIVIFMIFWICVNFSRRAPTFLTPEQSGQRNLGKAPEYDVNRWIYPVWLHYFVCYNSIFGESPDDLNGKPHDIFWVTHSQVVQVYPDINKFSVNACLRFWVCVWY